MNVRTERQTERQTDRPHELHVYVGLAQARPNKYLCKSVCNKTRTTYIIYIHPYLLYISSQVIKMLIDSLIYPILIMFYQLGVQC